MNMKSLMTYYLCWPTLQPKNKKMRMQASQTRTRSDLKMLNHQKYDCTKAVTRFDLEAVEQQIVRIIHFTTLRFHLVG